jgi:hypothetical protein
VEYPTISNALPEDDLKFGIEISATNLVVIEVVALYRDLSAVFKIDQDNNKFVIIFIRMTNMTCYTLETSSCREGSPGHDIKRQVPS